MAMRRRKRKRNGGFWAWASDHWFISGFILFPAVIALPVAIVRAVRGRQLPSPSSTRVPDDDIVTSGPPVDFEL